MALETTFQNLLDKFHHLRDALQGLHLTVIEDRPLRNEVLMVERLGDAVEDLRGWLEEGLSAATVALKAVGNPFDGYGARQALACAHDRVLRLEYKFFFDVVSDERMHDLSRFGRQRGREWLGWAKSVREALSQCREPLREVDGVLLSSWQELAERLGSSAVSVQTTNIGQQISAQVPKGEAFLPDGAT